ncbi:hypothetical protein D9M68_846820 [compost metagenome]
MCKLRSEIACTRVQVWLEGNDDSAFREKRFRTFDQCRQFLRVMRVIVYINNLIVLHNVFKTAFNPFEIRYCTFDRFIFNIQLLGYTDSCDAVLYIMHTTDIQMHIGQENTISLYIENVTAVFHLYVVGIGICTGIL